MIYQFAVSFALGVVFEEIFGFGWSVGLLIALLSFFLSLILFKENLLFVKTLLIVGLAFCLGVLRTTTVDISPDPSLSGLVGQKISFEAVVSDEPDIRDASARYTVKVNQNFLKKNLNSQVLLIADRFPEFQYGDEIKVSGKLDLPENFVGDNGIEFDYVSYLSKDRIHFLIYRPQIEKMESGKSDATISFLYFIKNAFIEKISKVVPEPNGSLLGGIIFGAKQSLGRELLDDFKKAGLIHVVVLSGYNITVVAAAIFSVASYIGKRRLGFIAASVGVVLFALMVGLGATVIRASVMALIALLARFLGRPADALRWLFIAALLMLFYNPFILLRDPSFQLSFMATLGLIIFSPFAYSFISQKFLFITERFAIREIVSSTLAVQFFVLPLLIKMSGSVSIISFIINPLVLPLIPWTMASGILTGALGLFSEVLSWPFGIFSYFITQTIIGLTEFFVQIPFATIQINLASFWPVFIWYLFYAFLYFKLKKRFAIYSD